MAQDRDQPAYTQGPTPERITAWVEEIAAARQREKTFREEGRRINEIYDGKAKDDIPFNILYSNTETLMPALYGATPRPIVKRRFADNDPIGMASATAGKRTLEFVLDPNSEEYEPFDHVLQDAVQDALLPGRGTTRVQFLAKTAAARVTYQSVCAKSVEWTKVVFGFSKKWSKTPWLAFIHEVDKDEAIELFGTKKAERLQYTEGEDEDEGERRKTGTDESDRKTATVYEVWDKNGGKKVRFISPDYKEDFLKVDDDPLGLTGFYPVPRPLKFHRKANNQVPTAIYKLYENQAEELNKITVRINRIIEALKVRGAYDSTIAELDAVFKADDNTLVPAENVAALTDSQGLDRAIWLAPIEKLVAVLQQLYVAREAIKQTIYEITGISDILRGQTKASETLGAQEIKREWGTLRLKRMQKEVQRYARDTIRIMLEVASKHFVEDTFVAMTGLPYATREQVAGARRIQAAAQQLVGSPVPPPPQMAQMVQQAQQVLQGPSWAAVMDMLKKDTLRAYHIDIETNSTVDLDATEDKQDLQEILMALGQFVQAVGPMVQQGIMPFQVAQAFLLTITRRYRFGDEVEDYIKAMQPPKPQDDGKQQEMQMKMSIEKQKADREDKKAQMEMAYAEREHQLKMAELQAKEEYQRIMAQVKIQEANNKLAIAQQNAALQLQVKAADASISQQQSQEDHAMMLQHHDEAHQQAMTQAKEAAAAKPAPSSKGGKK